MIKLQLHKRPTSGPVSSVLLAMAVAVPACGGGGGEESFGDADGASDTSGDSGSPGEDGGADEPPGDGGDSSGDGSTGTDGTDVDDGGGAGDGDTGTGDGDPPQPTVEVVHARELRGVWVASVGNINFPSRQGLSASVMKDELIEMLDTMEVVNLNAMFFQVRPEGDALYESDLEPWSRFLTGSQGQDPGFDPLQFLLDEAEVRNIEIHAWLNPYRAKSSSSTRAVAPHLSVEYPQYAYEYGSLLWMEPGAKPVQDRVVDVVLDLATRYELDGIHFDDYFYPYPDGREFPDWEVYQGYVDDGGQLSRDDWRRNNVNTLVSRIDEQLSKAAPHVRFGISPFGIYRPGIPEGITGLDQYAEIYADPVKWMEEGWVDYLAPQLYWPSTQTAQAYGKLIDWWSSITEEGRYIFAGNYLSQLGSSSSWTIEEFRTQMQMSRELRDDGSMGNIFFTVAPFQNNSYDVASVFMAEFYQQPVLTPPIAALRNRTMEPPRVEHSGMMLELQPGNTEPVQFWVLYMESRSGWELAEILPGTQATVEVPSGQWAVSAAGRHGVESRGVVVEVP